MSTFKGKLLEESLDFLRIDNFESNNYDGTYFFLSHFHTDHFKGIFDEGFRTELEKNKEKVLYCTQLTKTFLLRKQQCQIPSAKIVAVDINEPILLLHEDREPVQVTPLPAGHCPGSIMFLIEQGPIRVLYTGDFRIGLSDLRKFIKLHDRTKVVKKLNTLYLDTTFCDERFLSFPSRQQTLQDLLMIITEWLDANPHHLVGIWYNSYHGLEPLLIDVKNKIKTTVWIIDPHSYINYSCVPELEAAVCRRKESSRIHLCPVKTQANCEECARHRDRTRTIKPCAQSFDNKQLANSRLKQGKDVIRLSYSMHCSLEELIATVRYLSPDVVYPCALPRGLSFDQVLQNLQLDQPNVNVDAKENLPSCNVNSPPKKKICLPQENNDSDTLLVKVEKKQETSMLYCVEDSDSTVVETERDSYTVQVSSSDLEGLDSPPN